MGFPNYDADPNNNTTISGINIAEGCAPSGINNAIRQIMADAKAEDGAVVHKTGTETISGAKTFAGSAIFKSAATISGGATVTGGATIAGGMTVSGAETHSGAVTFGSGVTAQDGLTVSGGILISHSGGAVAVPATSAANTSKFLKGDGSWDNVASAASAGQLANPPSIAVDLSKAYDADSPYTFLGNQGRIAIPVRNTLPQSNGGTGASTRLDAVKELFNSNVGSGATSFLVVASNWASAGFASVDNAKAALGFTAAGISSTLGTTAVASAGVATKVGTATVGSTTKPVYISAGVPVSMTTVGSATNASSLGGVAAASYVQKTANIQRGSASLFASGTSVNAGLVTSKTVTFGSAFGGSAPHVMAIVRGGANSYAAGMNCAVQSRTASNAVIVVRSTYANAITTSAASYIDYVAFYI